jgi:hypothetical protein
LLTIEVMLLDHGVDKCLHLRLIEIDGQRAGNREEAGGNAREYS